jgi:hypothetical protein
MSVKGNKKRFEEDYVKTKKEADSEYIKEIDEGKKQYPYAHPDNPYPPIDPGFDGYGNFYPRAYSKKAAAAEESGTLDEIANIKASRVMDSNRIFDMKEDLDKQEEELAKKDNTRFSSLRKLLRGEYNASKK